MERTELNRSTIHLKYADLRFFFLRNFLAHSQYAYLVFCYFKRRPAGKDLSIISCKMETQSQEQKANKQKTKTKIK